MRCSVCGDEHDELDLEPAFRRPDDVVALDEVSRRRRCKTNDDLSVIGGEDGGPDRHFVRGVLDVDVQDLERPVGWGIWVEVNEPDFKRIVELWDSKSQVNEPLIDARLANRIPGYPDTIGVPLKLRLTGPTTRPKLLIPKASAHPFALECARGVCSHRVVEWLESMRTV
jgi:hypothetical protein